MKKAVGDHPRWACPERLTQKHRRTASRLRPRAPRLRNAACIPEDRSLCTVDRGTCLAEVRSAHVPVIQIEYITPRSPTFGTNTRRRPTDRRVQSPGPPCTAQHWSFWLPAGQMPRPSPDRHAWRGTPCTGVLQASRVRHVTLLGHERTKDLRDMPLVHCAGKADEDKARLGPLIAPPLTDRHARLSA